MGKKNAVPEVEANVVIAGEIAVDPDAVAPHTPSALPEVSGTLNPMFVRVTTESGLNLRGGPGMQHPIVAVLPQGTILCPFFSAPAVKGWLTVATDDNCIGWVDARYIEPVKPEEG